MQRKGRKGRKERKGRNGRDGRNGRKEEMARRKAVKLTTAHKLHGDRLVAFAT